MTKLVLVAAAQTDWRAQGRLTGDTDLPLNEFGHRQAVAEGQAIAELMPTAIRCGPEEATKQTATIIGHELRIRPRAMKHLREMALGHWEGLTSQDFQERFNKVYRQWRTDPLSVEPPEGEVVSEAAARLSKGLSKIVKDHDGETVVVVLGNFAFAIARCQLLHGNHARFWEYVEDDVSREVVDVGI